MSKQKGFTMIEMLIVISLFIILLPTIFAILSTILRQQLRMYKIVEAKRQGDAALAFMKERILREGIAIKNSSGATTYCESATPPNNQYATSNGADFRFQLIPNGSQYYYFRQTGTRIDYVTTSPALTTSLTANTVQVSNFQISCFRRTLNSPPMIQISYTVTTTDNTSTISLPYKTKVRLLSSSP